MFSFPIISQCGLCKALTQILFVKIHSSPILIINFVNKTFMVVIGKKNLINPRGISKQDKIMVFRVRIVIETIPIRFSSINFTMTSLNL